MTLSPEQDACVLAATSTADNLLISACAGGAKTTTMCAIARALGPGRSIVALAFNKDAAIALAQKMPYFVSSQTFHSFCYDALGRHLGKKPKADAARCRWILKDLVPDWKERREVEDNVLTLVSRFKSTIFDNTPSNMREVAERFDIDATERQMGIALRVLDECLDLASIAKSVDFDDMLWLALRLNVKFPQVALVLLDEAQDTNGVQRELLARVLGRKVKFGYYTKVFCNDEGEEYTQLYDDNDNEIESQWGECSYEDFDKIWTTENRLIAVGDPHQSIYSFRGADHDAMRALRDDFSMRELQLSVSYRCSLEVVGEAQKWAGDSILAREGAPKGSRQYLSHYSPEDFTVADSAGLCRNTAPLVAFAFDLLARSVPCHIVGKDIQVELEKLIDKIKGTSLSEFKENLVRHSTIESEKLRRKGKREAAANYEDKCAALLAVSRKCNTVSDVKAKLAAIFRDGTGLTLSTIHKAKGLEWETVFLLDWNLLPSPYAETDAAKQQEKNLQYVAVTRAKLNLKFINTGNWKV